MGQFRALGRPGGAGGVEHHSRVVGIAVHEFPGFVGHQFRDETRGTDGDVVNASVGRTLASFLVDAVPSEEDLGVRVAQDEGELATLVQRIHRYNNAAGPEDPVVDNRHLRDVG